MSRVSPINAVLEAKVLLAACEKMSGPESRIFKFCGSFLEGVLSHEGNQIRFSAVRKAIKALCAEEELFTKNAEKHGLAKSINFMIDSRKRYQQHLEDGLVIIQQLLAETDKLKSQLQAFDQCIKVPAIPKLMQYVTMQHSVYAAMKSKYTNHQEDMNSGRGTGAPGSEYGLKPFQDVVLGMDGHVLVWNDDEDDWDLADDLHPCRKMPGSSWGKFHHDMTLGEFFLKERRQSVEWSHAGPSKKLLDHLESTQFLMHAEDPAQNTNSNSTKILNKNRKIAAATGLPYPVCDRNNLERTAFDLDVQSIIKEPFVKRPKDVPSLDELSKKAEEVATGSVAKVKEVQEQEKMEYIVPQ